MERKTAIIRNGELEVELLLPGNYTRSRYDHSAMVEQIRLGDKTFLGREKIGSGYGLGGVGLAFCLEWADTALNPDASSAFPGAPVRRVLAGLRAGCQRPESLGTVIEPAC